MKLRALILAGVCATAFVAGDAAAAPWAEPGDRRLRSDLELLVDYGIVRGPATAWPIPWQQIASGIEASRSSEFPLHVWSAIQRIEAVMPRFSGRPDYRFEAVAMGATDPALFRDFGDSARGEFDGYARVERHGESTYLSLGVGYRDDPRNGDLNFDKSYAAVALGNWSLYGGYVEKWWGPGWESALIFSTNARPFPKVGITRLEPRPFGTKFLSWLGPWQLEAFAGLIDERREFSDHVVAGIRLSFAPFDRFEIGFTRALQLCGENRPCDAETWGEALVGFFDADNTGTFDEPGNQLAGVDVRFSRRIGAVTAAFYGEISGEDEDNLVIDQIAVLGGVNLSGPLGGAGAHWRLVGEYADTFANRSFFGRERPGSTYNNFIYRDGFTYRGRAIGHTLDGDSRVFSLTGTVIDSRNRSYRLSARHADINEVGRSRHSVSLTNETVDLVEAEFETPTRWGDLRAELRWQSDSPNTPLAENSDVQFEVGWRVRF